MKYCKKCDTDKPESEFSKDKSRKCGLQPTCKACQRAFSISWRLANPERYSSSCKSYYDNNKEKCLAASRLWKELNPGKVSASSKAYSAANSDKIAENCRLWALANPERISDRDRRYRAKKLSAKGSHSAEDVKVIFQSQRGICASCPEKLIKHGKNRYHIDHIHPLSKGGCNDKYNLQCLCPDCNRRKSAKDPLDWAKENGKLF